MYQRLKRSMKRSMGALGLGLPMRCRMRSMALLPGSDTTLEAQHPIRRQTAGGDLVTRRRSTGMDSPVRALVKRAEGGRAGGHRRSGGRPGDFEMMSPGRSWSAATTYLALGSGADAQCLVGHQRHQGR